MSETKNLGRLIFKLENEGFEVAYDRYLKYYIIEDIEGHICTMEVKEKEEENFQHDIALRTMVYIMDGEGDTTVHPIEKVDSIIYTVLDALDYDFEEVDY